MVPDHMGQIGAGQREPCLMLSGETDKKLSRTSFSGTCEANA